MEKSIHVSDYLIERFNAILPTSTIRKLPPRWRLVALFFMLAGVALVFSYLTFEAFQSNINKHFIALETEGDICTLVAKPLTGNYLASSSGYWQGEKGFIYNQAVYSFTFSNLFMTPTSFSNVMNSVKEDVLEMVNNISSHQNLAMNLLILMNSVTALTTGGAEIQYLSFTGDPSYVFDRQVIYSYVTTAYYNSSLAPATCGVTSTTTFDVSTATISTSFDGQDYASECSYIISPSYLNYYAVNTSGVVLRLRLDMRSLTTALAVNLGYLNTSFLEIVQVSSTIDQSFLEITYKGILYRMQQLYDIRYPGMVPIGCLYEAVSGKLFFCFIELGNIFGLPMLNAGGANYTVPEYCNCSTAVGRSAGCQSFSFFISLLFYAGFTDYNQLGSLFPLIDMINSVASTMDLTTARRQPVNLNRIQPVEVFYRINELAFTSQWSIIGRETEKYWKQGAFDFCGFNCTQYVIYVGDDMNQAISQYYYQLPNGSCTSLFNIESWENLAWSPPTSLTEPYYNCHESDANGIVDAIGISFANTHLIIVVASVVIPIFLLVLKYCGAYVPTNVTEEFSSADREKVLHQLSLHLLRALELEKSLTQPGTPSFSSSSSSPPSRSNSPPSEHSGVKSAPISSEEAEIIHNSFVFRDLAKDLARLMAHEMAAVAAAKHPKRASGVNPNSSSGVKSSVSSDVLRQQVDAIDALSRASASSIGSSVSICHHCHQPLPSDGDRESGSAPDHSEPGDLQEEPPDDGSQTGMELSPIWKATSNVSTGKRLISSSSKAV